MNDAIANSADISNEDCTKLFNAFEVHYSQENTPASYLNSLSQDLQLEFYNKLQKMFGIKFKVIFCDANLSVKEELRLCGLEGSSTVSFIDLENFVTPMMSNKHKVQNIKNLINKSLVFLQNHSLIICANGELLNIVKQEFANFVDSSHIVLIQTGGKDCSDLRLVQSIQKLFQIRKLDNYQQINLASGDGFFIGIIEFLKNKGFNVKIYGQKKTTHHQIHSQTNYIPLDNQNLVVSSL